MLWNITILSIVQFKWCAKLYIIIGVGYCVYKRYRENWAQSGIELHHLKWMAHSILSISQHHVKMHYEIGRMFTFYWKMAIIENFCNFANWKTRQGVPTQTVQCINMPVILPKIQCSFAFDSNIKPLKITFSIRKIIIYWSTLRLSMICVVFIIYFYIIFFPCSYFVH